VRLYSIVKLRKLMSLIIGITGSLLHVLVIPAFAENYSNPNPDLDRGKVTQVLRNEYPRFSGDVYSQSISFNAFVNNHIGETVYLDISFAQGSEPTGYRSLESLPFFAVQSGLTSWTYFLQGIGNGLSWKEQSNYTQNKNRLKGIFNIGKIKQINPKLLSVYLTYKDISLITTYPNQPYSTNCEFFRSGKIETQGICQITQLNSSDQLWQLPDGSRITMTYDRITGQFRVDGKSALRSGAWFEKEKWTCFTVKNTQSKSCILY
jgi:hypothetical protein